MFAKIILVFFSAVLSFSSPAQRTLEFNFSLSPEQCEKGAAELSVSGKNISEVTSHWSTGEVNTLKIANVDKGEHNVSVKVKYKPDSVALVKDTLLYFTLDKLECPVSVGKFFSPNDDQYNDLLGIGNLSYYPNFELSIFNKWGQRVHFQKQTYTPWDGKWLGVDLPDGTYYYVLFYDASNKNKLLKGDITILR